MTGRTVATDTVPRYAPRTGDFAGKTMAIDKVLVQAVEAHQAGRKDEAEKLYRKILLKRPRDLLAVQNLGALLFERGELDEAAKLLRRALSIDPRDTDALNNLGNTLRAQGQLAEAEACFRKAIAIRPNAMVLNSLGNMLRSRGDLAEAAACYEQALRLQPDYLHSHYHLAMTYRQGGRLAEAVAIQEQALTINPRFPQLLIQLGLCLSELGRHAEAIARYREALAVAPQLHEAWSNLGNALKRTDDPAGAEAAYREALRLKPDFPNTLGNLGTLLADSNRRREAIALFERVAALNPDHDGIWGKLSFEKRNLCDWRDYDSLVEGKVREQVRAGSRKTTAFSLITLASTPQEQLLVARAYAESAALSATLLPQRPPQQRARLRVGYLSADFHPHATAYLIAEMMERHDRSRFEIIAYSIGPDSDSPVRRRLVAAFDSFVDLRLLSHDEAAQRIHADDLDILIDLKGYTQNTRSEILARRPAPIQVNYLGYPGTMGASFIDYIIADGFIIPPAQHAFYDEKVVTLPHCYQPNDTRRPVADQRLTRAACGLPEDGFVFASFNNSYKITPQVFDVWMRLLSQLPGSVLWQLEAEPDAAENLRREAQARGVDPARLIFAPPLELATHLARQPLADLFLDTLPVNAHTTASDALWAGLPVLTCAGETFISRVAGSLLTTIGLPELITTSLPEYEALALALARDPARLGALRQKLAANRQTSPLFDIARFTRNLEGAYLQMQARRLAGQPPAALTVEDRS
jgi:protein O-GlcNAc transferase